jgi:hypothetical protein
MCYYDYQVLSVDNIISSNKRLVIFNLENDIKNIRINLYKIKGCKNL